VFLNAINLTRHGSVLVASARLIVSEQLGGGSAA